MKTFEVEGDKYFYIPSEYFNPFHWLGKLDEKITEIDEQNKAEFRDSVFENIKTVFAEWGGAAWDWFVSISPEIVGFSAIVCGAMMILSPLVGKSMMKPFGWFSAIGIVGAIVRGVSL